MRPSHVAVRHGSGEASLSPTGMPIHLAATLPERNDGAGGVMKGRGSSVREDFLHYLGRFTYVIFFVLVLLVLALFHYTAISFVVELPLMREFSGPGKGFGVALVGVPVAIVDVLLFRYVRGQILETRWIAENKRLHEEEMRREQLTRR